MDAFIAAGSVITKDVPDFALAISRPEQAHNVDWVKKRKLKLVKTEEEKKPEISEEKQRQKA
jgi:bifunctional N-acetylglucosamine-1-phosphate-uridyltransferase/glucosamine-1-phosphate-acetyltransferase GlmU-like protein